MNSAERSPARPRRSWKRGSRLARGIGQYIPLMAIAFISLSVLILSWLLTLVGQDVCKTENRCYQTTSASAERRGPTSESTTNAAKKAAEAKVAEAAAAAAAAPANSTATAPNGE